MRPIRNQLSKRSKAAPLPSIRLGLLGLLAALQSACAVRYHDTRTGTDHIWGLAHVKMRAAPVAGAAAPAVALQTETIGIGLHFTGGASASSPAPGDSGLSLGYDRRTRLLVPDDSTLSLAWPTTDLFDVRIGTPPPAPAVAAPASP